MDITIDMGDGKTRRLDARPLSLGGFLLPFDGISVAWARANSEVIPNGSSAPSLNGHFTIAPDTTGQFCILTPLSMTPDSEVVQCWCATPESGLLKALATVTITPSGLGSVDIAVSSL